MKCALKKGELFRLEGGNGGTLLRCLTGTLWVTTGDGVDYLLTDYRTLSASSGKVALIEALEDAEICFEETPVSIPAIRQLPGRVLSHG